MKRRLSDDHDWHFSPRNTPVAKCRRIQCPDVAGASPPPSKPSSQTVAPAEELPLTATEQKEKILHWLDSCDASPKPQPPPTIQTMAAPPTPRSTTLNLNNDRGRRTARRHARARPHTSRTPNPSKKPTPQSYRCGNMQEVGIYVDRLGQLPPAIDGQARRIFGLQSWDEAAQPDIEAQTQPGTQGPLAALAGVYQAESRLNARDCSLEGNWKISIASAVRHIAGLAPGTLCTDSSEKVWLPDLKPAASALDGLQEAAEEGDSGSHTPSAASIQSVSTLVDFSCPVDSSSPAVNTSNTSFPGPVPSLPPSGYSSTYSQSLTSTTTFNTSDPYYIFTPKPDITVGLAHGAFTPIHRRRLYEHQASGTILSDPHAAYIGMRFPFLIIETKGLSSNGSLVSAQNQAAISGACMLRILKDLDETTNLHSTDPPLCFSIVTEGPTHELWIHFEHEEAFHMEILRSWRTTFLSDAREFVQFLGKVMEWGGGRFRGGIIERLDDP